MHNQFTIRQSVLPLAMMSAAILGGVNVNARNNYGKQPYITNKIISVSEKDTFDYMKHNSNNVIGMDLAMCLFSFRRRKKASLQTNQAENSANNERTETQILENNHEVTFYYNNEVLHLRIENDERGRFVDRQEFNSDGEVIGYMRKEYFENSDEEGYVEYCKDKYQDYTRKVCNTCIGDEKHYKEEFICNNNPERNYTLESIFAQGKTIKMIQNGKVIFEKK